MNTIHAISNEELYNVPYTISGKYISNMKAYASVGMILLHDVNKKHVFIDKALQEYTELYSDKIICACSDGSMVCESVQSMFPNVCFFSMKNQNSIGEMLNAMFIEIQTDLVFVSWSDIHPHGISTRALLQSKEDIPICIAPVFEDEAGHLIPVVNKPVLDKRGISICTNADVVFSPYTFVPYDFVGIFNRKKMLAMQGFDCSISDSRWQLCDFAIRAYALGEYIRFSSYYRVKRNQEKKQKKQFRRNYMYHLVCVKYSFGIRALHMLQYIIAITCMRVLFKKSFRYHYRALQHATKKYTGILELSHKDIKTKITSLW